MLTPALAMVVALVAQDQTPLRATPQDSAPRHTALVAGDWLEVRGERQGYLQVYDHRRERPGYVKSSAVRTYSLEAEAAPRLGVLVDYFRDAPGQESLGIGYAALFLRVAPPSMIGPEVLDALGTMAERLGRRASARLAKANDASLAPALEAAESYGVKFVHVEREGQSTVCYDGEAFRRVLALGGTSAARLRAVMALTEPSCVDPSLIPSSALAVVKWQSEVLDKVDPSALGADVPARDRARLRLRRATVRAALAYADARAADFPAAKQASESAKHELELVERGLLADEDRMPYEEAALAVASVRWGRDPQTPATSAALAVAIAPAANAPGKTCVRLSGRAVASDPNAAPYEYCSYGVVWPSSVRIAPHDAAVTLAVSPLAGWTELLVLRKGSAGWGADTLAPAAVDPDLGYVELAGFSPDGSRILVVREARASGPLGAPHTLAPWVQKAFQIVAGADLHVEKEARSLANFSSFKRWQSATWAQGTLALR